MIFYKSSNEKLAGFVASKKIGNAVKRARSKRRMRALFIELQDDIQEGMYLFVAKQELLEMSYLQFKKNILWSFKKMGCIKE